VLDRPPGGPRKIFNIKRGPQPKKFGNRWTSGFNVCKWTLGSGGIAVGAGGITKGAGGIKLSAGHCR